MDSSLIFVVVIGLWALYLVPAWLRRRQQMAASRSVDRFSGAMRVLSRRPDPAGSAHVPGVPYVLSPPRESSPALPETRADQPRPRLPRTGLVVLGVVLVAVLAVATTAVAALTALVPVWAPAVPVGVVVALVAGLRARALRRRHRRPSRQAVHTEVLEPTAVLASEVAAPAYVEVSPEPLCAPADPDVSEGAPAGVAAQERASDGWIPVPVPLPAYLLKPLHRPESSRRRRSGMELEDVTRWHADWRTDVLPEVDEDDIPTAAPPVRRAVG